MRFDTILLDLDGTLTDPQSGITRCIQHALSRLGAASPATASLLWCIGPPLRESFGRLLATSDPALLDRALVLYRERFSEVGMYENAVYPGVDAALREIRSAGYRMLLATSKPHIFARRILEHFGLLSYFDGIYGSELSGLRVRKDHLIEHLLETERITPESVLMVGDREHDILGARHGGIRSGAVTYGYGTPEELHHAGPHFFFSSPSSLATFLVDP